MQENGGVYNMGDHKNFNLTSALPTATRRSRSENLAERKFWQSMGGEPLGHLWNWAQETPPQSLPFRSGPEREPQKALKLCHSEILTHLAVGAVCATHKTSPEKQNFYCAFPKSLLCSQHHHHSWGSRGQFNKPGEMIQVCFAFVVG